MNSLQAQPFPYTLITAICDISNVPQTPALLARLEANKVDAELTAIGVLLGLALGTWLFLGMCSRLAQKEH
jgi:hypothetical protein